MQELSQKQYSKVKLNISTVTADIELNASYTLTSSNVAYSVEKLNILPPNMDLSKIPQNYKITFSGTATIKNGTVDKVDGETVSIQSYEQLKGGFNFSEGNFANVVADGNRFSADVISGSDFLGVSETVSDMKVTVNYTSEALTKVEISYRLGNSTVMTVYVFSA